MKRSFSFFEKPVLFIMHRFPFLVPGINKVISVYYDKDLERLNSYSLSKRNEEYILEESDVNDLDDSFLRLRKITAPFIWLQPEDIPFEISSNNKVQLTIFNELNNNILLLRNFNEFDNWFDLFYIYFSNIPGIFGLVDSKKMLTTESKSLIGNLLRNSVNTLLSDFREDRELFISLSEKNQTIIQELNQIKRELYITKEKNKDGIIHLCKGHLEEFSRDYGYNFMFSDEAVKKLRDSCDEPGTLRNILQQAADFAYSTHLNKNWKEIIIQDYHLILNSVQGRKAENIIPETDSTSEIPIRYNKTFHFLNKLETAAQSVKAKNLLLTSQNVGHEFPSPVTPAAITDALKNHQSKINYLFKLLPNRWQIIRTEFRPVQNILYPKSERKKHAG